MARKIFGGIALLFALVSSAWGLSSTSAVIVTPPQLSWKELNVEQKKILAPLVREWDQMENYRRKKWLGIAERYPKLPFEARQRVDKRMQQWATMSPQQRHKIRRDYEAFSKLPPEKKAAIHEKWQRYSNLPEEEKKRYKRGEKVIAPPPSEKTDAVMETKPLSASEATTETGRAATAAQR